MQWFSRCTTQEFFSQPNNASACIKDERMCPNLHLDTGGIASMTYRLWPRRRETSAYAPKTNHKALLLGHELPPAVGDTRRVPLERCAIVPIISCSHDIEKPRNFSY